MILLQILFFTEQCMFRAKGLPKPKHSYTHLNRDSCDIQIVCDQQTLILAQGH